MLGLLAEPVVVDTVVGRHPATNSEDVSVPVDGADEPIVIVPLTTVLVGDVMVFFGRDIGLRHLE